jgi:hypothetical protein
MNLKPDHKLRFKRMKKNRILFGLAVVMIALIAGCGKMPQAEFDAAKAAMDSLKAHGADIYLPVEFQNFQKVYDGAMDMINTQNSKTFKSYGKAKEGLLEAVRLAEEVGKANDLKKGELLDELKDVFEDASDANNENKNLIPNKGGSSKVMAFQKDVEAIDNDLMEVKKIIEEDGNLMEGLELAKKALEESEDLGKNIASAVAASKPVKRPATTKTSSASFSAKKKK